MLLLQVLGIHLDGLARVPFGSRGRLNSPTRFGDGVELASCEVPHVHRRHLLLGPPVLAHAHGLAGLQGALIRCHPRHCESTLARVHERISKGRVCRIHGRTMMYVYDNVYLHTLTCIISMYVMTFR